MADTAARIGIDLIHQLRDGMHAVTDHLAGSALGGRHQFAVDHQQTVVIAFEEGFNDDRTRMLFCGLESERHFLIGLQADGDATAVIAVVGLGYHRKTDLAGGLDGAILMLDQNLTRHRQSESGKDLVGFFFI